MTNDFNLQRHYVGEGWRPLIEQLHKDLLALDLDYDLLQIKEKFGGLRYYIQMSDTKSVYDAQEALIAEAERKSEETCEFCGEPGKPRNTGGSTWIKTTCDTHHQERMEREALMPAELDKFIDEVLKDPEARATFDEAQARHAIIDELVRRRKAAGITQTKLAEMLGIGQSTVASFESETSDPMLRSMQRYARAIGARISIQVVDAEEVDK